MDHAEVEDIMNSARVCHLALADEHQPYVVPLCFGYREKTLYFHTGKTGRKMDVLNKNNRVCFEVTTDVDMVPAENPCKWNMRYRSVVGEGRAFMVEDPAEKRKALDVIVEHYGGTPAAYDETRVLNLAVIKVTIERMTGKKSKV